MLSGNNVPPVLIDLLNLDQNTKKLLRSLLFKLTDAKKTSAKAGELYVVMSNRIQTTVTVSHDILPIVLPNESDWIISDEPEFLILGESVASSAVICQELVRQNIFLREEDFSFVKARRLLGVIRDYDDFEIYAPGSSCFYLEADQLDAMCLSQPQKLFLGNLLMHASARFPKLISTKENYLTVQSADRNLYVKLPLKQELFVRKKQCGTKLRIHVCTQLMHASHYGVNRFSPLMYSYDRQQGLIEMRKSYNIKSDVSSRISDHEYEMGTRTYLRTKRPEKIASINYLVFRHIESAVGLHVGVSLESALKDKSMTPYERLMLTRACIVALEYVHWRGMIHGDVKPANFVLEDEKAFRVKLIDFGSAADTLEQKFKGSGCTALYCPPETESADGFTVFGDLYSLGRVLFWIWNKQELAENADPVLLLGETGEPEDISLAHKNRLLALINQLHQQEPSARGTLLEAKEIVDWMIVEACFPGDAHLPTLAACSRAAFDAMRHIDVLAYHFNDLSCWRASLIAMKHIIVSYEDRVPDRPLFLECFIASLEIAALNGKKTWKDVYLTLTYICDMLTLRCNQIKGLKSIIQKEIDNCRDPFSDQYARWKNLLLLANRDLNEGSRFTAGFDDAKLLIVKIEKRLRLLEAGIEKCKKPVPALSASLSSLHVHAQPASPRGGKQEHTIRRFLSRSAPG